MQEQHTAKENTKEEKEKLTKRILIIVAVVLAILPFLFMLKGKTPLAPTPSAGVSAGMDGNVHTGVYDSTFLPEGKGTPAPSKTDSIGEDGLPWPDGENGQTATAGIGGYPTLALPTDLYVFPTLAVTVRPTPTVPVRQDEDGMNHVQQQPTGYPTGEKPKPAPTQPVSQNKGESVPPFVADTPYHKGDIPIAQVSVKQFGAVGDGKADDTQAFLDAVRYCEENVSCGIVYVPWGMYRLTKPITVSDGITLRGENCYSAEKAVSRDSILFLEYGQGKQQAALTVKNSALMNLTLYYPEQSVTAPKAYSPAIMLTGRSNTLTGLTILNAYTGIAADSAGSVNRLDKVAVSAYNRAYDVRRCEAFYLNQCTVNPSLLMGYRSETLANRVIAPSKTEGQTMLSYMKAHGEGVRITACNVFSSVDTVVKGMQYGVTAEGTGDYQFFGCSMENVYTLRLSGETCCVRMDGCDLIGEKIGVHLDKGSKGKLYLNECTLYRCDKGVLAEGKQESFLSVYGCIFIAAPEAIVAESGEAEIVKCTFQSNQKITFGSNLYKGVYVGNQGGQCAPHDRVSTSGSKTYPDLSSDNHYVHRGAEPLPYSLKVFNVTDYGAKASAANAANWTDCTVAFQRALNAAAPTGGTVFIPGGIYHLSGTLVVPEGVHLRGIYGGLTSPDAEKECWLMVHGGEHSVHMNTPFITLNRNAGISGFNIYYADQRKVYAGEKPISYTWTVQGKGQGVFCKAVGVYGAAKFCDFGLTYDCTGYSMTNSGGCVYGQGFYGGKNSGNGWVEGLYFDPGWQLLVKKEFPHSGHTQSADVYEERLNTLYGYTKSGNGLIAVTLGQNTALHCKELYIAGAQQGVRFVSQQGKSSNGMAAGMCLVNSKTGISVEQADVLELINSSFDGVTTPYVKSTSCTGKVWLG